MIVILGGLGEVGVGVGEKNFYIGVLFIFI